MLLSSFCFAAGITEELERSLWSHGITTWEKLRRHPGEAASAISDVRCRRLTTAVAEAERALSTHDAAWIRSHWPEKELWRLWKGWCEPTRIALLDIETTGRTPGYDQITVIGLSASGTERAFVADRPLPPDQGLEAFPEAIKGFRLLVTFNGINFDVPFIERHFRTQGLKLEMPHLDLIFLARSLGLSGGLKDMERQVGIARSQDISGMRGLDAIALWGAWRGGDRGAYEKLVTYCKADCTNLAAFAEILYQKKLAAVYTPYAKEIDLAAGQGQQLSLF